MDSNLKKGIDCTGIAVIYFCHDGKGNFVMAKRNTNARDEHGRYDIGGGGLELHDTVENTIRKEIKEEYDADVLGFNFLGFRDVHREHNGVKTHWIALDFKVLVDPAQVKLNEPHKFDDLQWFQLNKLPENLHSQLSIFFNKYREQL